MVIKDKQLLWMSSYSDKNNDNGKIKQLGCAELQKYKKNIRLFSMSPRKIGINIIEKIAMFKGSKERLMFKGVFFSSLD